MTLGINSSLFFLQWMNEWNAVFAKSSLSKFTYSSFTAELRWRECNYSWVLRSVLLWFAVSGWANRWHHVHWAVICCLMYKVCDWLLLLAVAAWLVLFSHSVFVSGLEYFGRWLYVCVCVCLKLKLVPDSWSWLDISGVQPVIKCCLTKHQGQEQLSGSGASGPRRENSSFILRMLDCITK